jgi:hypothetical protein
MNEQQENRYSRLTVEQKKYLENGILNNVKNKDIAKILGISVNRVSSYKSRNKTTIGLPKAPVIRNWREEKELKWAILEIIEKYPRASLAVIRKHLMTDYLYLDWYPKKTWISTHLKKWGVRQGKS